MLIKDGNLDIVAFKEFFPKLDWKKVPRTLTKKRQEHFFIGFYEDDEMKVEVSVRPSKRMQIKESYKGFMKNGSKPKSKLEEKEAKYSFGSSVEVIVDDKFFQELEKVSKVPDKNKVQKLDWS